MPEARHEQSPPGLDVDGFAAWLHRTHPDRASSDLTAAVIAGGRSNLTYRIDGGRHPLVLRRPPLGHVLSSAHDMAREHRVIAALAGTSIPVPPVVDFVDDTQTREVTGTPFFVMEHVEGTVLAARTQNAAFTSAQLHALSIDLAETLADLHALDPAAVRLDDLGRGHGYLARQLATWRRQLDASRSRDLRLLDALEAHLLRDTPASTRTTLVHGDYRLDNTIVTDGPRIAAVLDWEMATIGDPLVDLGMLGLYWGISNLSTEAGVIGRSSVDPAAGYASFAEIVDAYASRAGIPIPDLAWYRAFAAFKLAVILEGIHYRFRAGDTVGNGFAQIGDLVEPLAAEGLTHLATTTRSS